MKNANCWFHGLFTWLLLYIFFKIFAVVHATEEQTVTVNTAKWAQIISDRFLSITIDPETILLGKDNFSDTTRILKLAQGLAPSYFRVGGPSIDQFHFQNILSTDDILSNKTITESQWIRFNDFAREAGFDIIICLDALPRLNGIWDPRNALDLISFSDKMGYKINWELGYELQKLDGKISAEQLAMDVNRLRNILNSFSNYKHSIIVGPDITNLYTKKDIDFLRSFVQEASSSLDAITWHPKYLSTGEDLATGEELDYMLERLIFEKERLAKMFGRQILRKPIWIAESNNNTNNEYFIHALNWAQELGSFAGIGIQTVMRQLNMQDIFEIAPSYWVSLLHKALVGEVVLDVRHNSANDTNIPVFCHCTNTMKNNKASELITIDNKYEPGAITFFAVNRKSAEVNLSVKLSLGIKQDKIELHQYLLSADHAVSGDSLLSRNVLLNGKPLTLEHRGNLPGLSPTIEYTGWNLTASLPPTSIGFWVIPKASVKLCVSASKKVTPHKADVQSQPLIKVMSVGSYISYHGSRNSETFGRDLKYSDNVGGSINETNREHNADESKFKIFKNKKHYSLKNKKFLEKKTQEFKHLRTPGENQMGSLLVSKNEEAFIDKDNDKPSRIMVGELVLEAHGNYTGNISTEQKSLGRLKRYAPESNNAIPFSGLPLDVFPQSSLSGRAPKTRRKKKTELKDKKDDRELRKDKLKQKDENIQASLFDPFFSSVENEEQYFHNMKRDDNEVSPFPSGDIYLKQGSSFEEGRNNDYDYVDRDEKEFKEDEDEVEDLETVDADLNLKPGEFFENIRGTRDKINEHFVGYGGELWEAETFTLATPTEKMEDVTDDEDAYDQDIIRESSPTEEEDRRRKAAAAKLLNSYLTEGYAENQSEESKHKDKTSRKTRIQRKTERKQEYVQGIDDDTNYFLTDHKDKTKLIPEKPAHHHHHHHIIGHSKSAKEGKQNHYDHAHSTHNYKDKTRKLTNHNEKHLLSEEDDIFFPHISHEKERDYKRNHAYHRNLQSSEEKIEPMKNSHRGREKAAQGNQIRTDALLLNNEHFESSSTSTKSSRQNRARKISHREEEPGSTNGKSKSDLKASEHEIDNNLSRVYEESSENKKVTHQNDRQGKKKTNKHSISASSNDYINQEKDVHSEKRKSKDKQKYSNNGHNTKYETKDKISGEVDSRSVESDTKVSKKKVQVMDASDSFETDESQMNSGEVIEDENYEHKDPVNPTKSNHKITVRSSSENFEDVKVKSSKHKEKNSNHRAESMKVNSSPVSSNNNEKVGLRKPKRIENTSIDTTINGHMSKKSVLSRKSSQLKDYSNEETTEKTEIAGRSSIKTHDSKHKSEKGNKNKQQLQEISLEQENDNTDSTEENSLEHSNKMETIPEDENLSITSSHSETETKNEPLSDEDPSNEDVSDQHNHNKQSQQKSLSVSKSKYKTKAKHISDEYTTEDNISDIQGEPKKRHTSSEHYSEVNKEFESGSEVGKLEGESKNSEEVDGMKENTRTPNDENSEKPSKEKETKRKIGKHKTAKKNDHHNRARRDIFPLITNNNSNTSLNHSYSSEKSNKEMSPNKEIELSPDTDLEFRQNELQHLIHSANRFIGNIVADDNDVKLAPNMLLVPQQFVQNEEYLVQDVLDDRSSYGDTVLEDISQENTQSSKIKFSSEDENFNNSGTESQTGTWTFRSDNSIEILNKQDAEPLIRENNAKREVDSKIFENAVAQSVMNKEENNKEQIISKSSPYQENMNSNHDKESNIMIKGDEESNRHILLQSSVNVHEIPKASYVNENTYIQDNHSSESSRNGEESLNEEKIFYLPESSLKATYDSPIETSDKGKSARNILILGENEFQSLLEKKVNEELSKEEVLYSKEKSNEMEQLTLELNSAVNQHEGTNILEDISMKSVAAPEYVDNLPMYFSTADPTNSFSEAQQNPESLIKMFGAGTEKDALQSKKTSEEHDDSYKATENKGHIEYKYHPNLSEDMQLERAPKAVMYVIENVSNMDKIEAINYEGNHMLNPEKEVGNSDNGLEMITAFENSQTHDIQQSSSKEFTKNIEVLDEGTITLYDKERSSRDTNTGEPVSLSSLSPETNLDGNDTPTKVSLVNVNEEARNNEPSIMSTNVSKEIAPSERSSSVNDVKKIKIMKPLALPKKNTDRLKLEQKYKERIQQLKERRAKIKAGLFKKPDAILKKSDKKIRKRRAIDKENVHHKSSLQQFNSNEDLSNHLNETVDNQDEKILSDPTPLWVTKDYNIDDSSEEQLFNPKFIQKEQHATPSLWNTDIFITPSHIVTESLGISDDYALRDIVQSSTEVSDTVSVPVTLHKTLLITESNPYYSDEEAVRDETDKNGANNEFISEKVLVKLTAPLINYEPLINLQQGTTYFHKIIPVHENDIDILNGMYSEGFESENTEVKGELDMDRSSRYAPSVTEGDTSFRNNFQSLYFAGPSNVKGYSNDKIEMLTGELDAFPVNQQDALATYETDNNRFIEDTSSKSGRDARKEVIFTSDANDLDSGLLFPALEVITDMQAAKDNHDAFINEDTKSGDQAMYAVRSKRALRTDYDPLNDDLLWPVFIPIIPENEKNLDAFLNKIDSQQLKEINNNMDSLQVISSENDMKKQSMNEHQMMKVNQKDLIPQSILRKLLSPRDANDKIFGSNSMNQVGITLESTDNAKADADLVKETVNTLHPNSLDLHILNFGEKEAGYNSEENELNLILSDVGFKEVESKPFYKNTGLKTNEYTIPVNSKGRIKYRYHNIRNYSPVKKIIEEYVNTKKSSPNSISVDAEPYLLLKGKKTSENKNSFEYGSEGNLKEVTDMRTNLLNGSQPKHYVKPNKELSSMVNLYLENATNNALNHTSTSNVEVNHDDNRTKGILHPKEDAVTFEGNSSVHNRPATKRKRENQKTAADSQPSAFHNILKTLTETVIGFLHQLSPWKISAD